MVETQQFRIAIGTLKFVLHLFNPHDRIGNLGTFEFHLCLGMIRW